MRKISVIAYKLC